MHKMFQSLYMNEFVTKTLFVYTFEAIWRDRRLPHRWKHAVCSHLLQDKRRGRTGESEMSFGSFISWYFLLYLSHDDHQNILGAQVKPIVYIQISYTLWSLPPVTACLLVRSVGGSSWSEVQQPDFTPGLAQGCQDSQCCSRWWGRTRGWWGLSSHCAYM